MTILLQDINVLQNIRGMCCLCNNKSMCWAEGDGKDDNDK